jgi:hypothetical protein
MRGDPGVGTGYPGRGGEERCPVGWDGAEGAVAGPEAEQGGDQAEEELAAGGAGCHDDDLQECQTKE